MADANDKNQRFWLSRARRERVRFNLGWWLQLFLPWVFAIGLGASALILALRTAAQSTFWVTPLVGGALLLGAGVAYFRARSRFLSTGDALTRLDADLRLHNRLTVAQQGVTSWPTPLDDARLALRWQWKRLFWPPLSACALALIAAYVPIPAPAETVVAAPSQPPSWTAMEEKLDVLEKTQLVEEKAREEFREAIDALRQRPKEDWYSHESLEASDHLKAQLNENMASLEKSLSAALGAMEASRQMNEGQFQTLQKSLDQALQSAAQAMQQGQMPLDPKLLEKLKKMDASNVRQLSAQEWKELQARMKEGVGTTSDGQKNGDEALKAALAALGEGSGSGNSPGQGSGSGPSQNGGAPGSGGTGEGPGSAPLTFSDRQSRTGSNKTEGLSNHDASRSIMGDPAGLSQAKHEADVAPVGEAGGAMSSAGQGGQATWQQTATPAEQAALQRFFK